MLAPSDGRSQHSSNRVSGISTRTMYQSTAPFLSQNIWPRWASRQFLTLPRVQTLFPVTLVIPEAQRLSLWDNWGDESGCGEGHWHAHTRGLPWGLPEVVRTVQQVHCNRRRLPRRGLDFHVYIINKSAHTKKSLETYRMHIIYIYIYMHIYMHIYVYIYIYIYIYAHAYTHIYMCVCVWVCMCERATQIYVSMKHIMGYFFRALSFSCGIHVCTSVLKFLLSNKWVYENLHTTHISPRYTIVYIYIYIYTN